MNDPLYPRFKHIINKPFPLRLGHAVELLITLPLVEQMTNRHEPHLRLCPTEQGNTIEN